MILIVGGALIFLGISRMELQKELDKIKNAKTPKEKFYMYDGLFKIHAKNYGFPWKWLKAIAKQESDLGQDSRVKNGNVSYDGLSYGLMQIAEGVGSPKEIELKGFGGKQKLNDPNYSIAVSAKLVGYLYKKYNGNMDKVFVGYNQGEQNTDKGKDYTVNYSADKISYKIKIKNWLDWIERMEKQYG